MRFSFVIPFLFPFFFIITACDNNDIETGEIEESLGQPVRDEIANDDETREPEGGGAEQSPTCLRTMYLSIDNDDNGISIKSCAKASAAQIAQVNKGNEKRDEFLSQCYAQTEGSCWCDQLIRPNPTSINTFHCTYGNNQVHQLIHPDEDTWGYAIEAVKIVEELEKQNILTQIIYNWWRPEPYNQNVGGAASRHPFGTSIDVRFETKSMQNRAFSELCKMRARGRIRAIGYYQSTAIHFGVGDRVANTWGKSCP